MSWSFIRSWCSSLWLAGVSPGAFFTIALPPGTSAPAAVCRRLLLAGAGEAGLRLLRELRDTNFEVVGFVDDDQALQGRTIGGWHVLGTTDDLESVIRAHRVDEVILCIPSAPKTVLRTIVAALRDLSVKTISADAVARSCRADVAIGQLRPVNMEDLLGRNSIGQPQDSEELTRLYRGSRILVTGAGGSIGSELVRQLSRFQPSQLILLDKDENNLYEMTCEIREDFEQVVEVIADIRNLEVMENSSSFTDRRSCFTPLPISMCR